MKRGYAFSFWKTLAVFFAASFGIFIFNVVMIRTSSDFLGVLWPILFPLGVLGPAVIAMIGVATILRRRHQSTWVIYGANFVTSFSWFMIVALAIIMPFRQGDFSGLLRAFLNPWLLGWVGMFVVVVVGLDRWIHTPKKSLTASPEPPKLQVGKPV